jgi:uncharacterized membrane protein YccC
MTTPISPTAQVLQRTADGLYQDLTELTASGPRGRRNAMTALAVALATTAALILRVDEPFWAAISAFVCSQATAPASIQRGILRILGTIAGASLALLVSPLLQEDTVALSLALFAVSTIGVLGLQVSAYGYAWLLGAITADMVLMALLSDPTSAMGVGVNRTAEVVIGTLSAMLVAYLIGPDEDRSAPASPPAGWSDLAGQQWGATQHALRAGLTVMLVPFVWNWLDLPNLSQTAVTVAAVMAVPALPSDPGSADLKIIERSAHRILGCFLGGIVGLLCLGLSVAWFIPWMLMLTGGIWIAAHIQASERGVGYVGTQGAVVFICTLIQGAGPPTSILPGIERLAGITGGLLILLVVSLLTAPAPVAAQDKRPA